ncbi:NAD(P)/FAD-dependent oxidoreductase [Streptomyces sp. NPDC092296]|uniref:NAD(P)/FAD-dependent oxidoreductase n=1 Tax=Streptomyces sp. NPDC092296 TaxID=3366012 RepID=UPI00382B7A3C
MTASSFTSPDPSPEGPDRIFDVCVYGAGIIGMFNALQYAKRGFSVAIVDELTEADMQAYKVGESLLIFSNAMLRSVCELDDEISVSFDKRGLWFIHGYENQTTFDGVTEWAEYAVLPKHWQDEVFSSRFGRAMFQNAQVVRPEVEAVLRDRMHRQPLITVMNTGRVADLALGAAGEPHVTTWRSRNRSVTGQVRSRWVVDCTGRKRFLARRFDLSVPLDDGFVTSAVWGQFAHCTDDDFKDWEYTFPEGDRARRDYTTVHLWGDGYWIWLIRLTKDRISVGVNVNRRILAEGEQLREVFWKIIRRYPTLDFLVEENLLDFSAYKNVQHISEEYVSADRYILAGDAAAIIDAYYSQGMSQAMLTSWHGANIVERDLREGVLDTEYVQRVNRSMKADWFLIRSIVKHKFSPAIADSRFFILDHLLDYLVFAAVVPTRFRMATWLVRTEGGDTSRESAEMAGYRRWLQRRGFLNRSFPFNLLSPDGIVALIERLRALNERNARWRLDNGIETAPIDGVLRSLSPLPATWRIPWGQLRNRPVSVTPSLPKKEVGPPDFEAGLPFAFKAFAPIAAPMVALTIAFDSVLTKSQQLRRRLGFRPGSRRQRSVQTPTPPAAVQRDPVAAGESGENFPA